MQLSDHFTSSELACHHCGVCDVTPALVDALEAIRTAVALPVIVDDAYRCPKHNSEIGGVPGSEHVLGMAADIKVKGLSTPELYDIIKKVPGINGIGVDLHKNYVHVDVRKRYARWCYDAAGKQCVWDKTLDV